MNIADEVALGFLAVDRGFIDPRKIGGAICKWLENAPERSLCDYFSELGFLSTNQARDLQGDFETLIPETPVSADASQTQDWSKASSFHESKSREIANDNTRFHILKQHAKGGLGVVYVAHDSQLQRDVAFKQIRADRERDTLSETKFLLEAEITGQLEHPGIVPVYALGIDSAGNP